MPYIIDMLYDCPLPMEFFNVELSNNDALDAFEIFKFEKIATEPLSGNPENLIEVINQAYTYLIPIMAVEYLYKLYPAQAFIINWGNIPGYDVESVDGTIIAECFATTSYKSDGKLTEDLKHLSGNSETEYKYEFFVTKILQRIMRSIIKRSIQI